MPQFTSSPALHARSFDLPAIMEQAQRLKGMRTQNRLREFQMQSAQSEQGRQAQLRGIMPQVMAGDQAALGQAAALDPSMLSELRKIPQAERDRAREKVEQLSSLLAPYADPGIPEIQKAQMWPQTLQQAQRLGLPTDNAPQRYDPQWIMRARAQAGDYKNKLDQADKAPGGYRGAGGDLEYIPGGPADPTQARRLAEAKREGGGGQTALQKDVPYIAKLMGVSLQDALNLKLSSRGKSYDDYVADIAARLSSFEGTGRAYEKAKALADLVYGRVKKPPEEGPDTKKGKAWWEEIYGSIVGGGETGAAEPKKGAAIMGSRKNPHMPKTQADFGNIPSGEIYRDPDDRKLYRKP